jgi:hypothetical protein
MFNLLFVPLQANLCAKLRKMIETLLISALIIAIGMAFFCVKLIFRKDGQFSSQHIHDSEAMKERGIHCVMDQDRELRTKSPYAVDEQIKH